MGITHFATLYLSFIQVPLLDKKLTGKPLPLVEGAVEQNFVIVDDNLQSISPPTRRQIDANFHLGTVNSLLHRHRG